MNEPEEFRMQRSQAIKRQGANLPLRKLAHSFVEGSVKEQYTYNFEWLGLPILQYPQDLLAMQEIIFQVKPDLIIETGVARGGSLLFYASLLELVNPEGLVVGIDNDIRPHNREGIEKHSLAKRIKLLEGSSIDERTLRPIRAYTNWLSGDKAEASVLVCLDSHHAHEHVLKELELYAPLVTPGSYLVVFDTIIEFLPQECVFGKPWGKGNSPHSAVQAFLKSNSHFEVDEQMDAKLLISCAPGGYLKRVK